ncbi:hypothetical protein SGLAM104S_01800 [Streptomyces glaucescens]
MGNAELQSIHVHPVKAFRGLSLREAVVEPWGLAGDRRWVLIDDGERSSPAQRQQPRLAQAAAELLPGGGLRLSAPGLDPLTVSVPEPTGTVPVEIFRDKVEGVPADAAAHAWCSAFLGVAVRLVHMDDPATRRPVDPEYARPGETVSFADGYPLLLTSAASLDALNSLIAQGDHAAEGPLPMNRFRPNLVVAGPRPGRRTPMDSARRRRGRVPRGQALRAVRRDDDRPDRAPSAAGSRCSPWARTAGSAANWSSATIWCRSPAARSGSAIRCASSADVHALRDLRVTESRLRFPRRRDPADPPAPADSPTHGNPGERPTRWARRSS